jgi:hypothetical protein
MTAREMEQIRANLPKAVALARHRLDMVELSAREGDMMGVRHSLASAQRGLVTAFETVIASGGRAIRGRS